MVYNCFLEMLIGNAVLDVAPKAFAINDLLGFVGLKSAWVNRE